MNKGWNLLLSLSWKESLTSLSLNLFDVIPHSFTLCPNYLCHPDLTIAISRWWSDPASAPRFTLTSWSKLLHLLLIMTWSIWFCIPWSGETHVTLWHSVWKQWPSNKHLICFTDIHQKLSILIYCCTSTTLTHNRFFTSVISRYLCIHISHKNDDVSFGYLVCHSL